MKKMVSIIVPIYNGERVLKRCVDSILRQSYMEWELLLINDGSKDESLQICTTYGQMDNRIRVIDKTNEGVSATRNRGMAEALGEYIQFIDCDDYVAEDYLQHMVSVMEQEDADLVIAGYTRHKAGSITENFPKEAVFQGKQSFAGMFFELYNRWFLNTPWNKLYKRECITSEFPLELSLGEDLLFNLDYIKNCETIAVIEEVGYQYCIENQASLAIQYREDRFENGMYLHQQVIEFAKDYLGMTSENQWQDEAFVKGVRFSMTNLMRAENIDTSYKKGKIAEWVKNSEVKAGYQRCEHLSKQDRFFGVLVRQEWVGLLYWIIKILG